MASFDLLETLSHQESALDTGYIKLEVMSFQRHTLIMYFTSTLTSHAICLPYITTVFARILLVFPKIIPTCQIYHMITGNFIESDIEVLAF